MTGVVRATTGGGRVTAASHPYLMFATVALALMMSSLDQTIVATALPALRHGLDAPITWAGWTITAYALGLVLMLMPAGQLSERYGRRRVFLASAGVFTTASLCCGLADNIYLLVGLRLVQAIGGAGFTPSATAIIVDHFGPGRDKAVGLFGSIFPIGGMAGPVFGGLFVDYWSWRGIFFVNVPIGAALMLLCLRYVPADVHRSTAPGTGRIDLAGAGLLGAGALGVMLALNVLGTEPQAIGSARGVAPAVIGVAALIAFARHIARSRHPIVPPRFVTGRGFGPVNVVNVVYNGLVFAVISLLPLYAVTRYGLSALASGTLLTAEAAAAIVVSPLAVAALRRTGYRAPIYLGAVIIAAGTFGLWAFPQAGIPAYAWLAGCGGLIGLGGGILSPASRNAGLQLEPAHSSSLAALRTMGGQLGSIAGISVMTALIGLSAQPSHTQADLYLAAAAVFLAFTPIASRIIEHHGSW